MSKTQPFLQPLMSKKTSRLLPARCAHCLRFCHKPTNHPAHSTLSQTLQLPQLHPRLVPPLPLTAPPNNRRPFRSPPLCTKMQYLHTQVLLMSKYTHTLHHNPSQSRLIAGPQLQLPQAPAHAAQHRSSRNNACATCCPKVRARETRQRRFPRV